MQLDLSQETILIVDDTPTNIEVLTQALSKEYEIQVAQSGEAAFAFLQKTIPDLILLDILMPGMDGYEVCEQLKADARTRDIPIIFITAKTEDEDEFKGLEMGAIDYITKPFNPHIVQCRIANQLELKRSKKKLEALNIQLQDAYQHIRNDFTLVSDLQSRLLPQRPLHMDGFELNTLYQSSELAGGDYYDYFRIGKNVVRLVIADVSGHGAAAAYIMAIVRTLFHLGKERYLQLTDMMKLVNSRLCEIVEDSGYFVTILAVELDTRLNTLEYVNAGHCPGILRHDSGEYVMLDAAHSPVGITEIEYKSKKIHVPDPFELLLYTDGLYEWEFRPDEWLDMEPFVALCKSIMGKDEDVLKVLQEKMFAMADGELQFTDDISAVWLGWNRSDCLQDDLSVEHKYKLLIVDDVPTNIKVLAEGFRTEHDIFVATNGEQALKIAQTELPDLILMDVEMPEMNGYEVCELLKADGLTQDIPVIFVTARNEEQDETTGLALGAVDYITKPFKLPIVQARVKAQLDLKEKTAKLERLVNLDGLTEIPNRRCFEEHFRREWNYSLRNQSPLSILLGDIDFFKKYNDFYGHIAGDVCLKDVAHALATVPQGPGDIVARYGGEEFIALLPETAMDAALEIAEKMRSAVDALNIEHSHSSTARNVTISLGGASIIPWKGCSPYMLTESADDLLYAAKKHGRNCVRVRTLNESDFVE